jgi:hypothetical protein
MMTSQSWHPLTDVGDVIIHHVAPKVWLPCAVRSQGDLDGNPTEPYASRDRAMAVAQGLLLPGRRIYVRHHDDAEWEAVS